MIATLEEMRVFAICRRYGVPCLWHEDVLAESFNKRVFDGERLPLYFYTKSIAIDYARRFGRFTRSGEHRGDSVPIDDSTPVQSDAFAILDSVIDARSLLALMPPATLGAFAARL